MNTTDLRIAFKMNTGNDANWAKTHDGKDREGTNLIRGYPRSIYGVWLEEQIGKPKYLRERYFQVKREAPTSNYYNPGGIPPCQLLTFYSNRQQHQRRCGGGNL